MKRTKFPRKMTSLKANNMNDSKELQEALQRLRKEVMQDISGVNKHLVRHMENMSTLALINNASPNYRNDYMRRYEKIKKQGKEATGEE